MLPSRPQVGCVRIEQLAIRVVAPLTLSSCRYTTSRHSFRYEFRRQRARAEQHSKIRAACERRAPDASACSGVPEPSVQVGELRGTRPELELLFLETRQDPEKCRGADCDADDAPQPPPDPDCRRILLRSARVPLKTRDDGPRRESLSLQSSSSPESEHVHVRGSLAPTIQAVTRRQWAKAYLSGRRTSMRHPSLAIRTAAGLRRDGYHLSVAGIDIKPSENILVPTLRDVPRKRSETVRQLTYVDLATFEHSFTTSLYHRRQASEGTESSLVAPPPVLTQNRIPASTGHAGGQDMSDHH